MDMPTRLALSESYSWWRCSSCSAAEISKSGDAARTMLPDDFLNLVADRPHRSRNFDLVANLAVDHRAPDRRCHRNPPGLRIGLVRTDEGIGQLFTVSQIVQNDRGADGNGVAQVWLLVDDLRYGEHALDQANPRLDLGLMGFRSVIRGVFSKVLVDTSFEQLAGDLVAFDGGQIGVLVLQIRVTLTCELH